ncbi:hypothetical protein ES703_102216 [subsurface metagenome]
MSNFRLNRGDILVNVNRRHDPLSSIKRWAAGPYEHIFMYMGKVGLYLNRRQPRLIRIPMLFESDGDGVILESLSSRYGQEVVVLRLKSELDRRRIPRVLEEGVKLAEDPQAKYDYMCIVKYIIPRLIFEKLRLPLAVKYHRDPLKVCSEAVWEVFDRARLVDILLPYCVPPMPGDFITDSPLLELAWEGKLSEGLL